MKTQHGLIIFFLCSICYARNVVIILLFLCLKFLINWNPLRANNLLHGGFHILGVVETYGVLVMYVYM